MGGHALFPLGYWGRFGPSIGAAWAAVIAVLLFTPAATGLLGTPPAQFAGGACGAITGALARHLAGVDPHGVLNRGYSYTTTADGRLVASVDDVGPGEPITTRVRDGSIDSVVDRCRRGE